jgi:hypothetical protein
VTSERVAEGRALLEAATPEPWIRSEENEALLRFAVNNLPALLDAAAEVDRLQALIDAAPHEAWCYDAMEQQEMYDCACWRAGL